MEKAFPHRVIPDEEMTPAARRSGDYIVLTAKQAESIRSMTPRRRGRWLRKHIGPDGEEQYRRGGTPALPPAPAAAATVRSAVPARRIIVSPLVDGLSLGEVAR